MECVECGHVMQIIFDEWGPERYFARCHTSTSNSSQQTHTSDASPSVPAKSPCEHLLSPLLGVSVLVFGQGCRSEQKNGVQVSVYRCDLHGKCVTFRRGTHLSDPTIMRCVVCPDRPNCPR